MIKKLHKYCFIVMCLVVTITEAYNTYRKPKIRISDVNYGQLPKFAKDCDCVCGLNSRHMRIVGGNVTKVHEFPWMAGISRHGKLYCGASLITRRHLLTAAHCIDGFDLDGIEITLGKHYIETDQKDTGAESVGSIRISSPMERKIKSVKTHSDFNIFTFNNDIAVLELDAPVEFSETLQPVCLPPRAGANYTSRLGLVTGWGRVEESKPASNLLRKVSVPIWSRQQCLDAGYGRRRITENMICAGYHDGKKDACQGDSGGPMHLLGNSGSLEIVGVVSWGRGCARPNYPGIYTRVANYLDWLHESLNGECLCPPKYPYEEEFSNQWYWKNYDVTKNSSKNNRSQSSHKRNGKFLFDLIFGIDSSDDDDSSSGSNSARLKNCTCECGTTNQENRIVGGQPTGVNRYPWIARLVYDGVFHCGASLLTSDYVLTAAHCVRRLKRSKIRIILGDHDQTVTTEAPAKMRAVSAVIRHRNFDTNTYNHDIALLKLRKPITFTKNIRPICLPPPDREPSGYEGTVVGWGRTSEGGMLPGIVREVQVPIWTQAQCKAMKYRASRITANMLCAGKGKMDSCQGDSGGPLLINIDGRYEIVGIVSWGVGCGRPGYPGVYTRLTRYLSWVENNLQDTCLCVN
ncbi:transmembrane protease serine 9-like [Chrysoperla carnea]|uniref:transmembrane protease serine 9-like n=1 Tax=Chrysoperla carnea TaxID=189513 RepID=UPI001D07EA42|nr:transmembrane protease serine 9-like [Chrysoperla carnea]